MTEPAERPDLDEEGRETNFTDTVTLYEIVDPEDGTGRGMFYTPQAAKAEAEPDELIAQQTYVSGYNPTYVD